VPGLFPIDGGYGTFQYLSWAVKFMIDANQQELRLAERAGHAPAAPAAVSGA
jgi:hypothetical protein